MRRVTAERVDQLLAAVLVVWLELQVVLLDGVTQKAAVAALGAVVCAGLGVRRRWPLVVGLGTQLLLTAVRPYVDLPAGPVTIAWFCALYALAVWTSNRWFVASLLVVVVANGGPGLLHPDADSTGAGFGIVASGLMVLVRVVVGGRDRQLRLAQRERDVAAREAVVEERERIARELHDVIGHHVSTMVVQAGAERRMLPSGHDETREVLATIERVGRAALDEMRRMVALLRRDRDEELVPQPTLADLPDLVDRLRATGLPVELTVLGEARALPGAIELSAYRIVQEALTNALKHAGGAAATVQVSYRPEGLELEVADEGASRTPAAGADGHGLVGMRERVAMYGGTLEAGHRLEGGFRVRVLLPVKP